MNRTQAVENDAFLCYVREPVTRPQTHPHIIIVLKEIEKAFIQYLPNRSYTFDFNPSTA